MSVFIIFLIAYFGCIAATAICLFCAIGFNSSVLETLTIIFIIATFIAGLGVIVGLIIWLIGLL